MSANDEHVGGGAESIELWRRLLEIDIELAEADPREDVSGELDEAELAAAQVTIFARLGIEERDTSDALVAAFVADLEIWRAGASDLALARDIGSIAETVEVSVPELRSDKNADIVELECDFDETGQICELVVMLPSQETNRPLRVTLIEPNGMIHTVRASSLGLARFVGLSISPMAGGTLRFELRR